MASPGRAYEVSPADRIDVPFIYSRRVPPGGRVFIQYSVDNSPPADQELTLVGAQYTGTVEMDEGAAYKMKFKIVVPGQPETWVPAGGPETSVNGVATKAPLPSPSPTAPRADVHKFVKGEVNRILEAGGSRRTATSLEVLFKGLETQLRGAYGVREDLSAMMLAATVEAIRERKQLPIEVKNQFTEANPPANFDELDSRLEDGARLYREAVFARLLGDTDAREFFKLDTGANYDDTNPLGNDAANEAFERICNSRCLGGFANVLGECLKRTTDLSLVNPVLAGERQTRLAAVIGRLPDDQRTALAKVVDSIPPGRKGKWADIGANGGLTAIAALVDPTFGIGTLALKAALEGLTGVSLSDVIKARATGDYGPLKDALLHNNIAVHTLKTEGGFLGRLKETFGRAIPLYGMRYADKSVSGYKPKAGEAGAPGAPRLPAKRDAASFINKACDAATPK